MGRHELARLLAERTRLPVRRVDELLAELFGGRRGPGLLLELLAREGRVGLPGFGTFELRPDRRLAGQPLLPGFPVPRRVAFRPSPLLREFVE